MMTGTQYGCCCNRVIQTSEMVYAGGAQHLSGHSVCIDVAVGYKGCVLDGQTRQRKGQVGRHVFMQLF